MIKTSNCVIVANGSFPTAENPLTLLKAASIVIACDGAIRSLHTEGILPYVIVGDMDSLPEDLRACYTDRLIRVEDQETNDLTKAVWQARKLGQDEIVIIGATGLREDHTLGNISLLAEYEPYFRRVELVTDSGWFIPLSYSTTLASVPGQQVSIFSLTPQTRLSVSGLRWPVKDRPFTSWWQGSLNEATGHEFRIDLEDKGHILVFRTYA
ncbi:MAG: thiamine diphosphokinase [Tannerellaceae bacterium]|nr:thiamine diphosphokinase [Tannerellaceae bacterium]MCD7916643.1 thiamine diphosphokinase [Tannerellaceae bacterium]